MSYSLELDEEGYPILAGGIRGDEEKFLRLVFQNLKRFEGNDRFPLCTEMEGKQAFVCAFDDPLVAQDVELQADSTVWKFLGELTHTVNFSEIRVDDWGRFHAFVGLEKIPAVMSRKAQASFLLRLSEEQLNSLQRAAPYRQIQKRSLEADDWNQSYVEKDTPWDMSAPNPVFVHHAKRMLEGGKDWFIPGAGRGHEIPLLEAEGKSVTAMDLSYQAKEDFHKLYPESQCKYLVGDFFLDQLPCFDVIYENLFFIAIDPALRKKAVQRISQLLKAGGCWGGNFYLRVAEGGPPFGLTEWELKAYTENDFEIVEWVRSPHSRPKRQHMELWALLKKKS